MATKYEILLKECGFPEVLELRNRIRVKRQDGFVVFLDKIQKKDPDRSILVMLNKIRLKESPRNVIMAVSMVRGIQIARNYANTYAQNDTETIAKTLTAIIQKSIKGTK